MIATVLLIAITAFCTAAVVGFAFAMLSAGAYDRGAADQRAGLLDKHPPHAHRIDKSF
jgi:FlaG/FlaF family flagellin (archaellin)